MDKKKQNIIIDTLKAYEPKMIGIFGSFARNENTSLSDLDILVRFKSPITLLQLAHLEIELTRQLGYKVDLVSEGSIKDPKIKNSIFSDLQIIY
jgi:uncharacterized protein